MERLIERGDVLARVASDRLLQRVGAAVERVLPGAAVTIEPGGVVVEARGLEARREADPVLRWIGGELR